MASQMVLHIVGTGEDTANVRYYATEEEAKRGAGECPKHESDAPMSRTRMDGSPRWRAGDQRDFRLLRLTNPQGLVVYAWSQSHLLVQAVAQKLCGWECIDLNRRREPSLSIE